MAESEDNSSQEKTHEATPQKLAKAREKGDVPQSRDLNHLSLYLGLLGVCLLAGTWMCQQLASQLLIFLDAPDRLLKLEDNSFSGPIIGTLVIQIFLSLSPLLAIFIIMPLISLIAQQSVVISSDKIIPKLSRLSLIQGFKNKFGQNALVEFTKNLIKLLLVAWAIWWIAVPVLDNAPAMSSQGYRQIWPWMGRITQQVLIAVTVITAIISALDWLWQQYSYRQKMMMTFQEMKEETKQSEGDQHIKAQRQDRGRQIATNAMLSDVQKADVVIVNPTHYAVALQWERKQGVAPVCIAKGIDDIALAIRAKANEYDVPIHDDPPLARTLYAAIDIGEEIHEDHYRAVAAALRFAQKHRPS